jgi:hypothetical protein
MLFAAHLTLEYLNHSKRSILKNVIALANNTKARVARSASED